MKKLLYKKGYHLEVTSWENDADNYRTITTYFETQAQAEAVKDLASVLFLSPEDWLNPTSIGNDCSNVQFVTPIIMSYVEANWEQATLAGVPTDLGNDRIVDFILELSGELLGYSENYMSRVYEDSGIIYISEDLYAEVL